MKLGMLCPFTIAGGYRCRVDRKKREKWDKDVQKYKRKQAHLEREKARLDKKVAKEERAAKRRKRRKKQCVSLVGFQKNQRNLLQVQGLIARIVLQSYNIIQNYRVFIKIQFFFQFIQMSLKIILVLIVHLNRIVFLKKKIIFLQMHLYQKSMILQVITKFVILFLYYAVLTVVGVFYTVYLVEGSVSDQMHILQNQQTHLQRQL
eukprot:TRINITY_DN638_c0_g1_i1.p3 TRINITY_DN638_c0_g1~~TRINITY_DN638_c0_g1_i1.p3  ORF type:complete len:205 (+),score=-50.66 TRINITY_DN638_c0_g1_i1:918-1532(+)